MIITDLTTFTTQLPLNTGRCFVKAHAKGGCQIIVPVDETKNSPTMVRKYLQLLLDNQFDEPLEAA